MRLLEALALRVKDLDIERGQLTIRGGKGNKDRVTVLPRALASPLAEHLRDLKLEHEHRAQSVRIGVTLPDSIARKFVSAQFDSAGFLVCPGTASLQG